MKRLSARYVTLLICTLAIILPLIWQVAYAPSVSSASSSVPLAVTSDAYVVRDKRAYVSPAGLIYGADKGGRYAHRIAHVMAHTKPDSSKPIHSIFTVRQEPALLVQLDEAWQKRGKPLREGGRGGQDIYDIAMGRIVGTAGERNIRVVVQAGTAKIITAYPVKLARPPRQ